MLNWMEWEKNLQKKMELFSCDPFERAKVNPEQYLDHFEIVCEVKGLGGTSVAYSESRTTITSLRGRREPRSCKKIGSQLDSRTVLTIQVS